ncbi:MAG: ABC transporter ATP-binding protein, partial [Spirochaetota bacterium]
GQSTFLLFYKLEYQERAVILTKNLTKKYGDFTAVEDLSLSIQKGEIYGFLGPNGAGKTTTIMMLLGISRPTYGEIYLMGERYIPDRLDLRKRIGVVPEKHPFGVWRWMTGYEYLKFFADLFEIKQSKEKILDMLKRVDLYNVRNKRISGFSRGMLQKLSIVRALLPNPDILFLDEPISGLDPIGIKQVRDLILSENREGRSIFISSHLLSEVEKICQRVAIIFQGKLTVEDTMSNILTQFSREREIDIDLEHVPDELVTDVKNLDFVVDASKTGDTLAVKVKKEGDFKKQLSEFVIKKNFIPLRINEKTASLEEAFVTLTKDNLELFTGRGGKK